MKLTLSLLAAIMLTGAASAGSCFSAPVYHSPVVTYHAPKAVIIPVAVYAVAYGGAYVPPVVQTVPAVPTPATPASAAQPSELQQILTAIKQVDSNVRNIDDRVKVLEAKVNGTALPPPKQEPVPPLSPKTPLPKENLEVSNQAVGIFQSKCASCHSENTASVKMTDGSLKGGGFVMFQGGKLLDLPEKKWGRVSTRIGTVTMPPKRDADNNPVPELTNEEASVLSAFIDGKLR